MAENSRLYGVELDSLTARIAKELYPEAKIQNRGFERTKLENGTFDVIIGNVPFGDFKPYDPEYARIPYPRLFLCKIHRQAEARRNHGAYHLRRNYG